ncbi:MAG: hypothetical protein AMXMBFR83_06980 [Phycisphaerae bacterium]
MPPVPAHNDQAHMATAANQPIQVAKSIPLPAFLPFREAKAYPDRIRLGPVCGFIGRLEGAV